MDERVTINKWKINKIVESKSYKSSLFALFEYTTRTLQNVS